MERGGGRREGGEGVNRNGDKEGGRGMKERGRKRKP